MSWKDFTLCSCPELREQWKRETVLWIINSDFTFDSRSGQGQDLEELDLFLSLQTLLKEEVFDEVDNINGRELDPQVFNSRLLVVWAQPLLRLKGNETFQAFVSVCKARAHRWRGLWRCYPAASCLCYYKLAAGYGNLQDQSRQAETLRTQEMHWADSGCIKSPRCRSLLSKTRRFFWFGLDVWVCSWWIAQLENWEIIHIALGLKVLIGEGNAQEEAGKATDN